MTHRVIEFHGNDVYGNLTVMNEFDGDGNELSRLLAVRFNTLIRILTLPNRSVHVVDVTDYSNDG